jgi:hypothetical protein
MDRVVRLEAVQTHEVRHHCLNLVELDTNVGERVEGFLPGSSGLLHQTTRSLTGPAVEARPLPVGTTVPLSQRDSECRLCQLHLEQTVEVERGVRRRQPLQEVAARHMQRL